MHKAGFVNIIGNPNVGKSTLMNSFVGEKLSIITSKAQTTRHRILGIVNGDDFQMVISDTPGIIKPAYELQSSMMDFVKAALDDADVLVYMVEIGEKDLKDEKFFEKIINSKIPVLLLINKIDILEELGIYDYNAYKLQKRLKIDAAEQERQNIIIEKSPKLKARLERKREEERKQIEATGEKYVEPEKKYVKDIRILKLLY